MEDLKNLIENYLYKEDASIEIGEEIREIMKKQIKKLEKSLSFYFGEKPTIEYDDKKKKLKYPHIEDLTNWVFTLCCRKVLRWKKETGEMTAFEYIVFRKIKDPIYFLFNQPEPAIKTLLEQEIRKDSAGEKSRGRKKLLEIRDYIGRILKKNFKKFSQGRYGLCKWNVEKYDNKWIEFEKLTSIYICHLTWDSMFYEERIQRILKEVDCPLTVNQIATTYQRLHGLLVREERFPQSVDEDGKETDFIETKEADGEIHSGFLSPRESLDLKTRNQKFDEFIKNLSEKEMDILKLKNYEKLDKDKLESDKEVALYFGRSHEAIRLWEDKIFKKFQQAFPDFFYPDLKDFMRFLAEKLQNYKVKLNYQGGTHDKKNNLP